MDSTAFAVSSGGLEAPRSLANDLTVQAEIIAFDRLLPTFAALNTEVLAISTDSEYSHLAWANTKREEGGLGPNLRLRLLADKSMKIARDYNVLLEEEGVALRAMFIIDPQGIIRQMTVNDIAVGRSTEEALRLIRALQFVGSECDPFGSKG